MRLPTIHLNGTSKSELERRIESAAQALDNAIELLAEAAPNARDYYPQGDGAFSEAQREHNDRMIKLTDVLREVQDIWLHVVNQ
jgi:hypothetical protein